MTDQFSQLIIVQLMIIARCHVDSVSLCAAGVDPPCVNLWLCGGLATPLSLSDSADSEL